MSAGEWQPSIVSVDQIRRYQDDGLLPREGCRLPGPGEIEPHPKPDERVLLLSHLDRGFALPPPSVFVGFPCFYRGAVAPYCPQLHHSIGQFLLPL